MITNKQKQQQTQLVLCKQRTFLNCELMLCALLFLAVRKRFTRCASNFACHVHIDTR